MAYFGARIILTFLTFLIPGYGYTQSSGYLIKAGKFFDSETGQFKSNQVILVAKNRIEAIKDAREVNDKDRTTYNQVIDLSSKTVVPGLIDAHTHLLNREVIYPSPYPGSLDMARQLTLDNDAYRALYGASRAKAYLESGITTVQDLGNSGNFGDIALKRAINEGLLPGPRMRCAGKGLATEGGQFAGLIYSQKNLASEEYRIVKGVADAVQAVRENITQGADVIKIYADNSPNRTMLSLEEIKAIVTEAHRYDVKVTAHATNNTSIWNAIIGGVDAIEHGFQLADSTMALMAKRKVVIVPNFQDSVTTMAFTEMNWLGKEEELKRIPLAERMAPYRNYKKEHLQRLKKHGVTVVFGSDEYVTTKMPAAEVSKRTLVAYVESGMSIPEALQAATLHAARHVRLENKIGVLKKGAVADIVAFDATLDKDIAALLKTYFVMREGKIVKDL